MNEDKPRCDQCKFYEEKVAGTKIVLSVGDCRFWPPTPFLNKASGVGEVYENEWCGQWQPIPLGWKKSKKT